MLQKANAEIFRHISVSSSYYCVSVSISQVLLERGSLRIFKNLSCTFHARGSKALSLCFQIFSVLQVNN